MSYPRNEPGGAQFNDLRNKARREGKPFQEQLALHALDGFLARLSTSPMADQLVLKGGVLLAAFDLRRPTRDVDLLAQDVDNDVDNILTVVCGIAALPFDDGLVFDTATATAAPIRDEDMYTGVRVGLSAKLGPADVPFHVDVNVGDPITPSPQVIELPRVLGQPVTLRGYPMEMVHAEKIVTAVSRGTASTRWRDFGDVYSLAGRHPIAGDDLLTALTAVAAHRQVTLQPLAVVLAGYADIGQGKFRLWRRNQGRDDLPGQFRDVLDRVFVFADPALTGSVAGQRWSPEQHAWV